MCAVPIRPLVEKLDMPEENISTFMCYLEEHEQVRNQIIHKQLSFIDIEHLYFLNKISNNIELPLINVQAWVKLLNPTYAMCKIHCYGGQHQLETLSKRNPIVKAAMRHHKPVIGK